MKPIDIMIMSSSSSSQQQQQHIAAAASSGSSTKHAHGSAWLDSHDSTNRQTP
jgi:hypothetical protein